MKAVVKTIKNIAWLCRPYWKYGKFYFILSISISVFLAPVKDIIYVYFPKEVVDLLVGGKSFLYVTIFASIVCGIEFIIYLIPCIFFCYLQKKSAYIDLKIKRDIYEKATQIDYKYIDYPEYYNKYTWALNEYAGQTNAARDFINNFLQYFLTITILLSIIATVGPWILLIEAVQLVLHAVINVRENKIEIKKKDELIPINRRLSYVHRLFYLKDYSTDIRATSLNESIFNKYEKVGKKNIDIVGHYAKKLYY